MWVNFISHLCISPWLCLSLLEFFSLNHSFLDCFPINRALYRSVDIKGCILKTAKWQLAIDLLLHWNFTATFPPNLRLLKLWWVSNSLILLFWNIQKFYHQESQNHIGWMYSGTSKIIHSKPKTLQVKKWIKRQ